jgi:hypothetical protein
MISLSEMSGADISTAPNAHCISEYTNSIVEEKRKYEVGGNQ